MNGNNYARKMSTDASDNFPKKFEKSMEILPLTKYGVSTFKEFKKADKDIQHLEWLKNIGLTRDQIDLYFDNEKRVTEQKHNIESSVLKKRLEDIYEKIKDNQAKPGSSMQFDVETTENDKHSKSVLDEFEKVPIKQYPDGHPISDLKYLEDKLFGHLKSDILPINKRRKILRRLERRKERILSKQHELIIPTVISLPEVKNTEKRSVSLWDVKKLPKTKPNVTTSDKIIGPKRQAMYTVKDGKIVRLDHVNEQEYRAVDIVLPINKAEKQLLEGTKMSIDDIKKIERFKDYEPGEPSKVLYLKNIASSVSQEQMTLLFNQFIMENGGPVDVKLMSGRMRGQAFVTFTNQNTAIRAVEEINGTILSGRPIIAQFGRKNSMT